MPTQTPTRNNLSKTVAFLVLSFLVLSCSIYCTTSYGQSSFSYVDIPANASQNALGGQVVSLANAQPLSFLQNPGLLDSAQNNNLEVGISPVFGQGIYTAAGYTFQDKKKRQWAVGFRGISFGEFAGTDAVGNPTQTFGAGNALLSVAHSRKIKYITFGVAAKIITSFIESYNSTAFLLNVGVPSQTALDLDLVRSME